MASAAATGSATLPSGTAVNPAATTSVAVWSYGSSLGGSVGAVGRTLVVNQGDTVNLVVHNRLTFQGGWPESVLLLPIRREPGFRELIAPR
mgnify:CR=1 FL=1